MIVTLAWKDFNWWRHDYHLINSLEVTFFRSVGCEPPQLVVPQPEIMDCNESRDVRFTFQWSLFVPRHTYPVSRILGPSWPACGVDMGVRREVDLGRKPQQTKVVHQGVGVPIWVLKFPASEVYERVLILLSWHNSETGLVPDSGFCLCLLSYSNYSALTRPSPASHANDCINGWCTGSETITLLK